MSRTFDEKMEQTGRLVLTESARGAFGQSIKRAQDLYRKHATTDRSVDEFIAERRAEAARENTR